MQIAVFNFAPLTNKEQNHLSIWSKFSELQITSEDSTFSSVFGTNMWWQNIIKEAFNAELGNEDPWFVLRFCPVSLSSHKGTSSCVWSPKQENTCKVTSHSLLTWTSLQWIFFKIYWMQNSCITNLKVKIIFKFFWQLWFSNNLLFV